MKESKSYSYLRSVASGIPSRVTLGYILLLRLTRLECKEKDGKANVGSSFRARSGRNVTPECGAGK